jgi:hypothetical protein
MHVGDAAKQTEYVLEAIRSVIETAGGTMADVTFNQIFITDWANYGAVNTVYAKYFPGDKPARYCIQYKLVRKEALVEAASTRRISARSDIRCSQTKWQATLARVFLTDVTAGNPIHTVVTWQTG